MNIFEKLKVIIWGEDKHDWKPIPFKHGSALITVESLIDLTYESPDIPGFDKYKITQEDTNLGFIRILFFCKDGSRKSKFVTYNQIARLALKEGMN